MFIFFKSIQSPWVFSLMVDGIWVQSSDKVGGEKLVDIDLPDIWGSVCLPCVHKINNVLFFFFAFMESWASWPWDSLGLQRSTHIYITNHLGNIYIYIYIYEANSDSILQKKQIFFFSVWPRPKKFFCRWTRLILSLSGFGLVTECSVSYDQWGLLDDGKSEFRVQK